jgi:hypothetical protein
LAEKLLVDGGLLGRCWKRDLVLDLGDKLKEEVGKDSVEGTVTRKTETNFVIVADGDIEAEFSARIFFKLIR